VWEPEERKIPPPILGARACVTFWMVDVEGGGVIGPADGGEFDEAFGFCRGREDTGVGRLAEEF